MKIKNLYLFALPVCLVLVLCICLFSLSNKSIGLWHFYHLVFSSDRLYIPILTENFSFHTKGFFSKFKFKPKYRDIYELGYLTEDKTGFDSDKFSGKLKIEFFKNNLLIDERIVTKFKSATYLGKDLEHYSDVALCYFVIPMRGYFLAEISVRITVLEPDKKLAKYEDKLKLYIRVSPVP